MRLLRHAAAARLGAGDPHHRRAAQRARELARLPVLERRARRDVDECPKFQVSSARSVRLTPSRDTLTCDAAMPIHHVRRTRCARSRAGASPLHGSGFPGRRRCPTVTVGDAAGARRCSPRARGSSSPCRPTSRAARRRSGSTACRGETVYVVGRRAVGDRPASGRQSGLRSRRQPVRHLQRIARAGSAGLDLPRHAGAARASRSPRASSTRRRWRSVPTAACTCRAASRARSIASTDDGTHEQVASDLGVACGLAFDADGWMYVGDRSGTIFRVRDGARDGVRDAAAERGRVSPGDEPGRRAVRQRADARLLRSRLPHRP